MFIGRILYQEIKRQAEKGFPMRSIHSALNLVPSLLREKPWGRGCSALYIHEKIHVLNGWTGWL